MGLAVAFMALATWRLSIPSKFYFDEIHYVPAARKMLELVAVNREHPLFAKEVLAASIHFLGDRPFGWRFPMVLFGGLGLFAFGRTVWHASQRRWATIAAMILLATNFMWFVQSRIAMLDMVEASLCMVGLWQFAGALRETKRGAARRRLVFCGIALGLSLGAKWSSAPALAMPGLCFLILCLRDGGPILPRTRRRTGIASQTRGPAAGISLVEAFVWLGLVPLVVYWLTFLPAMFYAQHTLAPFDIVGQHKLMFRLQDSVKKHHPYQTYWYQWVVDWRGIWYLFKTIDGAPRGIVMLGNPFSMIAGLFALVWSLWAMIWRRRSDVACFVALYLGTLMMWALDGKPVQFYYHYLLPGAFLMALLAFALEALALRRDRWRWTGPGGVMLAVLMFVGFFPIISGLPMPYTQFYNVWIWLPSWR